MAVNEIRRTEVIATPTGWVTVRSGGMVEEIVVTPIGYVRVERSNEPSSSEPILSKNRLVRWLQERGII